MPNILTSIFVSNPATEPVEAPHPNTGVYVTGTQATTGGPWTVTHTLVTKTTTPLTMVGRLKNFPAVTVSVVASGGPFAGNIFNNVLATPTGSGATGTSSTAINVAVTSTTNNAGGYRLLVASASTGPFAQLYQGATASYPHTGLSASQTKYYQWQYVGGGYYDDSPVSAVFSGTTLAATATIMDPIFIIDGDSISTENYASGWHADFQLEMTNQLGAKTLAQLNAVGLTATAPLFTWVGVSGITTATMNSNGNAGAAFVAGKSNILLTIAEPYNTLRYPYTTATPAQAAADYATYCTNRKAAQPWKGIVGLMGFEDHYRGLNGATPDPNFVPRPDFTQLQADMITAIRGKMAAGTAGVDILAVVDPVFDDTVPAQSADGVHPTQAAYAASLTKRLVAGVMEMLFATVQPAPIPRSSDLLAGASFFAYPTQNGALVTTGNPGSVISSSAASGYGTLGLSNYKLAAGINGWFGVEIKAADALNVVTSFSDANAMTGFSTAPTRAGFYRDSGGLNAINNGVGAGNVGTALVGDFVRIRRANAATTPALYLEKSSDRGMSWVPVYTYTYTSAADLFLVVDCFSTGKAYYPQGVGLSLSSTSAVSNLLPGATYVNFPTTAKVTNSNNVIYSKSGLGTGYYGGTQVPIAKLAANTSGFIAYRFAQPDAYDAVLFFRADYVEGGYATGKADSWISSNYAGGPGQQVARYDAGAATPVGIISPPVFGEFVRIRRDVAAGKIYEERSNDGVTWTPAYTYLYYSAADLFVAIDISGPGVLYYPQGVGLVAAP